MKLSDINQKLTERPGGFGGVIKSKLKQQVPFARGVQRKGKAEEALLKGARKIKAELLAWKGKAFRSSGGEKAPLSMNQFLGWVKKSQPKYAKGIEAYARGDKDYAEYFSQNIDAKGKQSSTATDDKVKTGKPHQAAGDGDNLELEKDPKEPTDKQKEDDATRATYKKMGDEQEADRIKSEKDDKQDLTASKGDDKEPKVDTSASIYEARLRAILEADEEVDADAGSDEDVGVNRSETLEDNQIDTLITMGIEKQIELDGGETIVDDPKELSSQGGSEPAAQGGSSEATDDFLSEYQVELENVLTKVQNGTDLDKRDQVSAKNMLHSLD